SPSSAPSSAPSSPPALPPYLLEEQEALHFRSVVVSFSVSTSRTSPSLLINLAGGRLLSWDLRGVGKKRTLEGRRQGRYRLRAEFNEGGGEGGRERLVAAGSEDGRVCLWKEGRREGGGKEGAEEPMEELKGHGGVVNDVAWCPSNPHVLASCSDDGSVRVWGPEGGGEGGKEGGMLVHVKG
ncbi:transducin wd40 domain-containing protein, partial [Nannochloropsis gaditana]